MDGVDALHHVANVSPRDVLTATRLFVERSPMPFAGRTYLVFFFFFFFSLGGMSRLSLSLRLPLGLSLRISGHEPSPNNGME